MPRTNCEATTKATLIWKIPGTNCHDRLVMFETSDLFKLEDEPQRRDPDLM